MSALDYLHREHSTAHRDIKAKNILLNRQNCVRLIDFGFSRTFNDDDATFRTACGSPQYIAPEIAAGLPYSKAADLWSAGIVLYSMVTGELPFPPDDQQLLFEKIRSAEIIFPAFLTPPLINLLNGLLTRDPTARLTVAQTLLHPWCSASALGQQIIKTDLDHEILASLATLKVDVGQLEEDIQREEHTPLTAMYISLERERLTDSQKDLRLERRRSLAFALRKAPVEAVRPPHARVTMQVAAIKSRTVPPQVRVAALSKRVNSLGKPFLPYMNS
jgi:serine/threonine protein kinase